MSKRNKNKRITSGGNIPQRGQTAPNTIVLTQPKRFGIDIADFVSAVRSAESVDYSIRYKLYDLYEDIMFDEHLTTVIEKREDALLLSKIEFVRDNKPVDEINDIIQSPWFKRCMIDILAARWWGFTLLQFHKDDDGIKYDLIPRKHVNPIRKIILRRQTDITGIPWEEYKDLVFIGGDRDLGRLVKAIPHVIYKRNDLADWAQFGETFGAPIQEYIYDSDDNEARKRAYEDAQRGGGFAIFIHAKDTELQLKEAANKSGSVDVFEKLHKVCNAALSKLFLGNTLTTDVAENGTQSLGTVHQDEEDEKKVTDVDYVLNVLNYDLRDVFLSLGINTQGGRFCVPEKKIIDQTKRASVLKTLKNDLGLPISDDQIYEEFDLEKPADYEAQKAAMAQQKVTAQIATPAKEEVEDEPKEDPLEDKKQKKGLFNTLKSFFAQASTDDEADHLSW